jgi:hypothetical protein
LVAFYKDLTGKEPTPEELQAAKKMLLEKD